MALRSVNQNGNAIWYIQFLQNVTDFLSNKLSRTKIYYVRLADSLAYVKVKLFASKNDSKIKCTIEKMDYFYFFIILICFLYVVYILIYIPPIIKYKIIRI